MKLDPFVDALRKDLEALAPRGDTGTADLLARIGSALEASVRLRLLEAVSQAAHELGTQIPSGRIETRLVGTEPILAYVEDTSSVSPGGSEEAYSARLTLRLPGPLKTAVERWAGTEGVSVNTWIVQTLSRAADRSTRRAGSRLTGYARS